MPHISDLPHTQKRMTIEIEDNDEDSCGKTQRVRQAGAKKKAEVAAEQGKPEKKGTKEKQGVKEKKGKGKGKEKQKEEREDSEDDSEDDDDDDDGDRKRGAPNYTTEEQLLINEIVARLKPVGALMWDNIASEFNQLVKERWEKGEGHMHWLNSRDGASIKRRFDHVRALILSDVLCSPLCRLQIKAGARDHEPALQSTSPKSSWRSTPI